MWEVALRFAAAVWFEPAHPGVVLVLTARGTIDHYLTRAVEKGRMSQDDKDAERIKKLEERLPREKLLSNYVLLIPKAKLEDTLKKRAELLEKKEDEKK
jgi:hypothetical protein